MSELLQDLKFEARTLLRRPGFTAVALAILAIGIGANTAIFSFVNGVLLRPLPYSEPERIVRVLEKPPGGGRNGISTLNYLDWERQNSVFEFMAAEAGVNLSLTGIDEPIQLRASRVRAHYFDVFGIAAGQGRTFITGEDQIGHNHVAVLSHAFWKSQFGGDPALVGRAIQLNGEPYTVVGILPEGSAFDRGSRQIWVPLGFASDNQTRDFHWMSSVARLKPAVTLEQARAQMDAVGVRIAHDFPQSNQGWGVNIESLADIYVGKQLRQSLYVLLAAAGMVLLIACANLANLNLARGMARGREVAIRTSLGAGRGRIIRQFLTESVLLSTVGGVLGLGVGFATTVALKLALPPNALPIEADVRMDGWVLSFTFALAFITGAVSGLFPAFQAVRQDLAGAMKQGGPNSSTGRQGHRVRNTLVVAEVMLAFVLLTGAGLLIRSFLRLQDVEIAYDAVHVLTANLPIPEGRFADPAAFDAYLHRVMESVSAVPGVHSTAISSALPLRGWGYGMPFLIAGSTFVDPANRTGCGFKMVTPSYFKTIGMRLVKGRFLDDRDAKGSAPALVVNESMAKKYFPSENPIGKRLLVQAIGFGKTALGAEVPWEIVGVVSGEKNNAVDDPQDDDQGVYVTLAQSPVLSVALVVRGSIDAAALQKSIIRAVHAVNQDQTVPNLKTLEQTKIESMGSELVRSLLLSVFAGVALLLSAIGIYGVLSYSVAQRTREIGIRTALGATSGSILGLILRSGMTLVGIGLGVGLAAVFALTRLLSALLYGVGERDPATLAAVAGILAAVALLACYLPARRASQVNPNVALRSD